LIRQRLHYQKLSLLADRREDRNWETFLPKGKKWASWSENKILVNNGLKEFITPEQFEKYEAIGKDLGFRHVESGALVRSSYKAHKHIH